MSSPPTTTATQQRKTMSQEEASNPKTKPARLVELSQSTEASLLEAVTQNPSTPLGTLLLLAETYPKEFLENSLLPLLLLEDPNFLHAATLKATNALLGVHSVPAWVVDSFATSPDEKARSYVAGYPHAPVPTLELLAQDQDQSVRRFVAGNPNTPTPLLELLAKDKHEARVDTFV
jgi:hypothetical protein